MKKLLLVFLLASIFIVSLSFASVTILTSGTTSQVLTTGTTTQVSSTVSNILLDNLGEPVLDSNAETITTF